MTYPILKFSLNPANYGTRSHFRSISFNLPYLGAFLNSSDFEQGIYTVYLYQSSIWNGTFFAYNNNNGSSYWVSGTFIFSNEGDVVGLVPLNNQTPNVIHFLHMTSSQFNMAIFQISQDAVTQLFMWLVPGYPNKTITTQFWQGGTFGLDGNFYVVR